MKKLRNIIILIGVLLISTPKLADAQQVSLSTNALTWANFGTMNIECGVSVSKHFTVFGGFKCNPWELRTISQVPLMNKQITGYAGAKYWPWHVYSGWWFGAKTQFQDFAQAGIWSENLVEGQALGAGLSAGYSLLIGSHVNIDFGLGGWGGRVLNYTAYKDIGGYDVDHKGAKNFVFLDNIIIAISYVF